MLVMDHGTAERALAVAALDPARPAPAVVRMPNCERFVDGLCRVVGACGGCLLTSNDREGPPIVQGLTGHDEGARDALLALAAVPLTMEWRDHLWVRHPAAPDYRALAVTVAPANEDDRLLLLFAPSVVADDDITARVAAMVPGLAMMVDAMRQALRDRTTADHRQRAMTAVLRQSECGLVAVRADHSILFANDAAQAILVDADGIEVRRNMLRPTRYQDAVRFQAALDAVMATRRRGLLLLLERNGGQRPLIAGITPVDGSEGGGVSSSDAAAVVCLLRPEGGGRGLEPICQLHGLSPVETQIVARLASGQTLAEAAARLRIKPDTARTYLKQVFAKTDTHRQTDLLQLFLRYQRAVGGDVAFEAA